MRPLTAGNQLIVTKKMAQIEILAGMSGAPAATASMLDSFIGSPEDCHCYADLALLILLYRLGHVDVVEAWMRAGIELEFWGA